MEKLKELILQLHAENTDYIEEIKNEIQENYELEHEEDPDYEELSDEDAELLAIEKIKDDCEVVMVREYQGVLSSALLVGITKEEALELCDESDHEEINNFDWEE